MLDISTQELLSNYVLNVIPAVYHAPQTQHVNHASTPITEHWIQQLICLEFQVISASVSMVSSPMQLM